MKLFRLFLFLTFSMCSFALIGQSCALGDLSIRLNPCNGNEFSINYDFTFSNPASSRYRLFVDGEEIGIFPYHQRNMNIVLDGLQPRAIQVRVEDSEDTDCSVEQAFNFLGCDAGSCELTINSVDTEGSTCSGDGTFDMEVEFSYNGAGDDLLNVYANGNFLLQVLPEDSSGLYLFAFLKSNNLDGTELITISVADNPACSADLIFETVECSGCNIFNIDVTIDDCSNGEFYATINFDVINTTSSFILGGNGETYGNFGYDELPVTIGPLPASPDIEYEFLIIDLDAAQCFNFEYVGVVVCNDTECLVTNLTADNMTCNGESAYDIEIDFNASGTSSDNFDITLNGNVVATITSGDLPFLLQNIDAVTPGEDIITVCSTEDAGCCETIRIQRPNCSCELADLQVVNAGCEDNEEDYFVELALSSSLGAGTSFDVFINGAIFTTVNDVQGSIVLNDISLGAGDTDEITVCSVIDDACCISVNVTKPDCEFICPIENVTATAGECEELLFPATVSVVYTGAGTDNLVIEVNGVAAGTFTAGSFPVILSGLPGDGETTHDIEVFTSDRRCSESFELEPVSCSSSVNEGALNGEISSRIYNGELILEYSIAGLEMTDCSLIDMSGRVLWSQKEVEFAGNGSRRFLVNGLSNGVYILRMSNENFVYVNKILAR